MKNLHVWIDYHPRLYQDLIVRVFHHINQSEIGVNFILHSGCLQDHRGEQPHIDVILHSLDRIIDRPDIPNQPDWSSQAILIAFSPKGNQGWRRLTPSSQWELIRPFGLQCLLVELLDTAMKTL